MILLTPVGRKSPSYYKLFRGAFSLVEVVLALGIISFGMVAIFALLPTGLNSVREAKLQEEATNYLLAVTAELHAAAATGTSPVLKIDISSPDKSEFFFDQGWNLVPESSQNKLYRLVIRPLPATNLQGSAFHVAIVWPAMAQQPTRYVETVLALRSFPDD